MVIRHFKQELVFHFLALNDIYDCDVVGTGIAPYVIKFVSDLRQVGGFLRVLRFPPPIKLIATI